MVRIAATISGRAFVRTWARMLRRNWTRQRWMGGAGRGGLDRLAQVQVSIGNHQLHALEPVALN
jgi:hypothetical protein